MSKLDEKIATYKESLDKFGGGDHALLEKVTKGLGPSIYNADSNKVACSDPTELERMNKSFCMGKLGVSHDEGMAAIEKVCKAYSTPAKHRAVFYYMVVKELGKESVYA